MRIFVWLFRAFVFFALFAFALNNQHDSTVHWFFGHQWQAPMVFVVLIAFALGCAFGVLAMVPNWWRQRQATRPHPEPVPPGVPPGRPPVGDSLPLQPPRDGL